MIGYRKFAVHSLEERRGKINAAFRAADEQQSLRVARVSAAWKKARRGNLQFGVTQESIDEFLQKYSLG